MRFHLGRLFHSGRSSRAGNMAKNDANSETNCHSSPPNKLKIFTSTKKKTSGEKDINKSELVRKEEASFGKTSQQVVAGPSNSDVKEEDQKDVNTAVNKKSNGLLSAIRALFGFKQQQSPGEEASAEKDLAAKRKAERNVSASVAAKYGIKLSPDNKVAVTSSSSVLESSSAAVELKRARKALSERGDKLSSVEMQSDKMASEAQNLAQTARLLAEKYRH